MAPNSTECSVFPQIPKCYAVYVGPSVPGKGKRSVKPLYSFVNCWQLLYHRSLAL